jgi:hypothetical protein
MNVKNCNCSISSQESHCCSSGVPPNIREVMEKKKVDTPKETYESALNERRHVRFLEQTDISQLEDQYLADNSTSSDVDMPTGLSVNPAPIKQISKGRMMDDSRMLEKNRRSLRRFESLSIGGKTLTGMSIGGFEIDVTKAAMKAREVLPLPASKLPIIFVDEELNFYHHFFKAVKGQTNSESFQFIVTDNEYFYDEETPIGDMIEDLITTGYNREDDETSVLLKKVITTTFEMGQKISRYQNRGPMLVAANLWGFQYIEAGMQCDEESLHMWMVACYMHYKTLWFNAFKQTGIPDFANRPMRMRRDSVHQRNDRELFKQRLKVIDEEADTQLVLHQRRRKSRSSKSEIQTNSSERTGHSKPKQWMRIKD